MEIVLLPQAEADRDYWKRTGNKAMMSMVFVYVFSMRDHY